MGLIRAEHTAAPATSARPRSAALFGDSAGLFAVVFLAFGVGAILSWSSFGSASGPAFFYPPAGITVAALLQPTSRRLFL